MSVRPETLALLDRMFGDERSVDDALARIENAANELYSGLDHLEAIMRTAADALDFLVGDDMLSEEQTEALTQLRTEAQWSESHRGQEFEAIETATSEISKLAERWS